ncbi:class I SAM-dependent methyltransferase [Paenibacillus whitsoniae]|uniref:Class I SAM-dependent methyltransferase n=1 Tax=Paenibacillus whitsoniae TaxID=2496558 RepID=A0A430J9X6_9BACL|nr:class I SAM-dependent methyltransferase [Paenibacillus whitsoniae]RTE07206.1 class I SAM-dependent methyltransferase [Paenibacillus whitsoniae]
MLEHIRENNVERFMGFGSLYDENRPHAPKEVVALLTAYLGGRPETVVDVGCGTGLSTFLWLDEAERIVGVEPSDDMRAVSLAKWEAMGRPDKLQFVKRLSHQLELPDASADIITCSQSFHWMEPQSTLTEFARVLRPGGVFAAYDYDWPPVVDGEIELHYDLLTAKADKIGKKLAPEQQHAHRWNKFEHLQQIQNSGLFRYSRELVFHQWEMCSADRFAGFALSQGGFQTALKQGASELQPEVNAFRERVDWKFEGGEKPVLFGYRMRIGVI